MDRSTVPRVDHFDKGTPRLALTGRKASVWSTAAVLVLVTVAVGLTLKPAGLTNKPAPHASSPGPPTSGTPVCGQSILNSPYNYDGAAGTFTTSGTPAGLPTFGKAGTDFPNATSVIVISPGNLNSYSNSYDANKTVYYFKPGTFVIQNSLETGDNSAYVGGYTASAGKAILDGVNGGTTNGDGGNGLSQSNGGVVNSDQTWEYLTIENFTSNQNDALMGDESASEWDNGNTYKYNTIGPNEYGYIGDNQPPSYSTRSSPGNGGGYAINMGSNTTVEYNCLTQNAQGAFNGSGYNINISHNEISWNGLAIYPDTAGSGESPNSCGCSGGGKLGYTLNAVVDDNYVHDNYNTGIWLDFDNSGADISGNYVASNWASGIAYEASYNANISDNTLVGNEWASDGPWPAGYKGGDCGNISCTVGGGAEGGYWGNPAATIDLSDSGGNANLNAVSIPSPISVSGCSLNCVVNSKYSGELLVEGNVLINNFGGIYVYTDTDRYPMNIDGDSACGFPLAPLQESASSLYYLQYKAMQTASSDAKISGSSVTSAAGTTAICDQYGNDASNTVTAPSVGMAVFDMNSGHYLGNIASVTSAHAFTLNDSPGNETGARLMVSAYGGCGPADYYGGGPGKKTGQPAAEYWDNCIWGARNITVSGNTFSLDASAVADCTANNLCGFMSNIAFNAGVPLLMQFFDAYSDLTAKASGGLGDVWLNNTYIWSGGGPGEWQFEAGQQGNQVTRAEWTSAPYSQDAGSTFTTHQPLRLPPRLHRATLPHHRPHPHPRLAARSGILVHERRGDRVLG